MFYNVLVTVIFIFDILWISGDTRVFVRGIIKLFTSIVFWRELFVHHIMHFLSMDWFIFLYACNRLTNVKELLGYGMQMGTFIYCQGMQRLREILMQVWHKRPELKNIVSTKAIVLRRYTK